jgi:hypothetical protein
MEAHRKAIWKRYRTTRTGKEDCPAADPIDESGRLSILQEKYEVAKPKRSDAQRLQVSKRTTRGLCARNASAK